jgi:hypothetical protein
MAVLACANHAIRSQRRPPELSRFSCRQWTTDPVGGHLRNVAQPTALDRLRHSSSGNTRCRELGTRARAVRENDQPKALHVATDSRRSRRRRDLRSRIHRGDPLVVSRRRRHGLASDRRARAGTDRRRPIRCPSPRGTFLNTGPGGVGYPRRSRTVRRAGSEYATPRRLAHSSAASTASDSREMRKRSGCFGRDSGTVA